MRYIFLLFACLFTASLSAEMIGKVEYQLPKQGQGWKVASRIEGSEKLPSTTIIYNPENTTRDTAKEAFAVHVNKRTTDINDKDSFQNGIERGMKLRFQNPKAVVNVLEKTSDSVLYEWSVTDSGQEKIHGWSRVFTSPSDTMLLTFQTEKMDDVKVAGPIWLKTLKEAKLTTK